MIVYAHNHLGLPEACAKAFEAIGATTRIFYTGLCNTWYDRYVIHTVNHYAHTLRLVPKTVNLFQGHPKSHKEYRSRQLFLLCQEFNPDMVFLIRGEGVKVEVLEELRRRTRLLCWFVEGEYRLREIVGEMRAYHHLYFMSSKALEWGKAQALERVGLLQHAVDTNRFHPMGLPKIYAWCFLGSHSRRRQEYLASLMEASRRCVIYGPKWRRRAWREPRLWLRVRGKGLLGDKVNHLYNQCKVVVSIASWGNAEQGPSGVNMRFLEMPASGACLLTDYASDAERLLVPGEDFVSAESAADMKARLAELLADDEKRDRIARNGCEKAKRVRTYRDLVRQICADWAS